MILGHGGNLLWAAGKAGCSPAEILDMSSNINPLGPPPGLIERLSERLSAVMALPEADAASSRSLFAASAGLDPERVLAGAGTTQFIYALPQALGLRRALVLGPTYADYADACRTAGVGYGLLLSEEARSFTPFLPALESALEGRDAVFICNPNNPTGALIPGEEIRFLARRHPRTLFVVDESYLPFAPEGEGESLLGSEEPNLVVLHSLSKLFRIPGLRVGFLIGSRETALRVGRLMLPWSLNSLAQEAVSFLLERPGAFAGFIGETRAFLSAERESLGKALGRLPGFRVYPSRTSFLLIRLPEGLRSGEVQSRLVRNRILIRDCANFEGLSDRFIRVSLKDRETNGRLVEHLAALAPG